MSDLCSRAQILIEALPYIRRYHGETVVVKYGGAAMVQEDLKRAVMQDIALLYYVGLKPIVVHGGGKEISDAMKAMGKEPAFVNGLRVTDLETMRITEMVLVGRICGEIVQQINSAGGRAVGLSGKDGHLLRARKVCAEPGADLGYVGNVEQVNPAVLATLTRDGFIPVVSPVAFGEDGNTYNLNADHAASSIAIAMNAVKLILLTDVRGLYRDLQEESSYLPEVTRAQAQEMIEQGKVSRGMIPKVKACLEALEAGVARTHIVDGRLPHAVLMEIFTDSGIGTMVVP
jgi:acetylglutamate kinase